MHETTAQRIEFRGSGGWRLVGRLERPLDTPRRAALLAPCFTCGKDLKGAAWLCRRLAQHGLAVLRFDFAGLGESSGDFAQTNLSTNVEDLLAAAAALREQQMPPRLLIGHSLGAAAALLAAPHLPEVTHVVALAAAGRTDHLAGALLRQAPELESTGAGTVAIGGQRFTVRRQLLDDLRRHDVLTAAARLSTPLLLIHSLADEITHIRHAEELFAAARQPKSFFALRSADHLLSRRSDAAHVADLIWVWLGGHGGHD